MAVPTIRMSFVIDPLLRKEGRGKLRPPRSITTGGGRLIPRSGSLVRRAGQFRRGAAIAADHAAADSALAWTGFGSELLCRAGEGQARSRQRGGKARAANL